MSTLATIIGTADATHYLVGNTDLNGNFIKLPNLDSVVVCASLAEAKALLKSHDYDEAELKLQSAYDEMCGISDKSAGMIEQNIKF